MKQNPILSLKETKLNQFCNIYDMNCKANASKFQLRLVIPTGERCSGINAKKRGKGVLYNLILSYLCRQIYLADGTVKHEMFACMKFPRIS